MLGILLGKLRQFAGEFQEKLQAVFHLEGEKVIANLFEGDGQ
jgi:hypothetical protein